MHIWSMKKIKDLSLKRIGLACAINIISTPLLGWYDYPINWVFQLLGLWANLEYNKFKPQHSLSSSPLRAATDCLLDLFLASISKLIIKFNDRNFNRVFLKT